MATLTLKFGDDNRELDLEKPEDLQKAKELAEKGWAYEKGQTELKDVSKERDELKVKIQEAQNKLDGWNYVLAEAQKGDLTKLNESLTEMKIKIPETKKDDADFLGDAGDKVTENLQTKIDELSKKLDTRLDTVEGAVFNQYMNADHARLETKFNGQDGWPAYDRKAVYDHSLKNGIQDMEKAYRDLNFDAIMSAQQTVVDKHKKKIDKVKGVDPGGGGDPPKPPKVYDKKHGGYEAAAQAAVKEMQEQGKSVYNDDK